MKFMNTWEVDEAVVRHRNHPMLSKATKLLADLRDLSNAVSDGWAYWPKPIRASKLLQTLIQENANPTKADLQRAVAPIKAFLTREAKNLQGKTLTLPD